MDVNAHYQMPLQLECRGQSPGVSLRVYCISRVFCCKFICLLLFDNSSFCLFSHSVLVAECCALQVCLKEAAKEPIEGDTYCNSTLRRCKKREVTLLLNLQEALKDH